MKSRAADAAAAAVEGLLDLVDAFLRVPPRTYLAVALAVVAAVCFAAWGPTL